MAQRSHGLLQAQALGQQQADLAVAAQVAGGGQHQVAHARQAHEGVRACAQGHAQARDLHQAAGDEGRSRIQAQLQAIAKTRGNGQHVLDCAAHFHANQIVVGVDAQRGIVKSLHQRLPYLSVFAGRHQGGGQALGHFAGKAGAAECAAVQAGSHLRADFMDHEALHGLPGVGQGRFEALGQPGHGHAQTAQLREQAAHAGHRRSQHHQVLALHRLGHVGMAQAQSGWQGRARQVALVHARRPHGLHLGSFARPEGDVMALRAVRAGVDRQGRSPGARAHDDDLHACTPAFS